MKSKLGILAFSWLLSCLSPLQAASDIEKEALIYEVVNEIGLDQWNQVIMRSSVFITEEMDGWERARIMRAVNAIQIDDEELWQEVAVRALSLSTLPEMINYGHDIVAILEEMSMQLQN